MHVSVRPLCKPPLLTHLLVNIVFSGLNYNKKSVVLHCKYKAKLPRRNRTIYIYQDKKKREKEKFGVK